MLRDRALLDRKWVTTALRDDEKEKMNLTRQVTEDWDGMSTKYVTV